MGPLDGTLVVDLTRVLAGPLATMLLGDMGADVIKVERPGSGDDTRAWGPPFVGTESAYYLSVNRNKRSLTLDLGSDQGIEILAQLIRSADVVIDNFKTGTMERWGFDAAWYELHAPAAVRCSISGYGSSGPMAGRPGYDFILQAETGLMSITGEPAGEPMKLGVAIVDFCAGLLATISVLGGLAARAASGRGQRTEVNLHDTGLAMLANVAANYLATGTPSNRFGNSHPNIVPYRSFQATDGQVAVGVGNDDQFARLALVLRHPEWGADPRFATNRDRVANRLIIDDLVQEVIGTGSRAHWVQLLNEAGVPAGPINDVAEALTSEQARGMVAEIDHPLAGMIRLLGVPIHFAATPAAITRHPPLLGEHTTEVLTEVLGMKPSQIAALQAAGVV